MSKSDLHDFEVALGQYVFYRSLLKRADPNRKLFLAVEEEVLNTTLSEPIARPPLDDLKVTLLIFDPPS